MMRETPNSFYNSLVIDMRKMSCYDVGGHVSSRDMRFTCDVGTRRLLQSYLQTSSRIRSFSETAYRICGGLGRVVERQ